MCDTVFFFTINPKPSLCNNIETSDIKGVKVSPCLSLIVMSLMLT